MTVVGTAKLSTTNPGFGSACMLFDGSSDASWVANPALSLEMRAGAFQVDFRIRLDTAMGGDDVWMAILNYGNGDYGIAYEWAVLMNRKRINFYYGNRGSNQSVVRFIFPGSFNLDAHLGEWHSLSLARDSLGRFGAWLDGELCTTYQYAPLGVSLNYGAETVGTFTDTTDYGTMPTTFALRIGNFSTPGMSWAGALDEFRYVVGTSRNVLANYTPLSVPFANNAS